MIAICRTFAYAYLDMLRSGACHRSTKIAFRLGDRMRQYTTQTQQTYDRMWNAFQNGMITEGEWIVFCRDFMTMTLAKIQPMLIRIKRA